MFTLAWVIPSQITMHLRPLFCATVGHTRVRQKGTHYIVACTRYWFNDKTPVSSVSSSADGTGRQPRKTPETGFRVCRETREASMFTATVINHQTTAGTGTVTLLYPCGGSPLFLRFISTLHNQNRKGLACVCVRVCVRPRGVRFRLAGRAVPNRVLSDTAHCRTTTTTTICGYRMIIIIILYVRRQHIIILLS